MDFNRNLRIVRTSGSSYPFPYKSNVLWVHHDENNNPVSEIWDHGKWVPVTGVGSGSGDVIIDTKMSDSSSNAIANKIVKKYVDGIASKTDASILSLNEGVAALQSLIDTLNPGYQFMGVATPETNPGTPDQKVFYIANGKSIYPTFGGIEVSEDEVVILYYDTAWHKLLTGIASQEKLTELEDKVDENALISNSLAGLVFNNSIQHQKAKKAIKAIWFTYGPYISDAEKPLVDALRNNLISLSTEIQITYLYNISGTYGCVLRIVDANDAICFQKFVAGIHTISGSEEVWDISVRANTVLYPNNSSISGYPFQLHIAIDWNALSGETITSAGDNPITIIFGDVAWGERVPTISVKDQIEFLSKSSIVGKNIVCFGDSLTEIVDTTNSKHYTDYLADMTGANFINVGIGGSQIRRRLSYDVGVFDASKSYAINDFCIYTNGSDETRLYKFTSAHTGAWNDNDVILAPYQQNAYSLLDIYSLIKASCQQSFADVIAACKVIKETQRDDNTAIINRLVAIDWSQVDAITIFAGTNDWYTANSLGAPGSNDANKTLGAINEIIRLFLTEYPQVKVFWFTPIIRWVSGFNVGTNPPTIDDTKFSDNYSVEGNGTLKDESAAIIQEVTKNHIPVCDMYNNFGWNKYNCKLYFAGTDGTHPRTYDGVTYLAKKISEFIVANNVL